VVLDPTLLDDAVRLQYAISDDVYPKSALHALESRATTHGQTGKKEEKCIKAWHHTCPQKLKWKQTL